MAVAGVIAFVGQLRKKIEPMPSTPRYILTEPWVGTASNSCTAAGIDSPGLMDHSSNHTSMLYRSKSFDSRAAKSLS